MSERKKTFKRFPPWRCYSQQAFGAETGVSLVESLVAVAILGLALTALLSAVAMGSMAVSRTEERVTAENLARSELEYVKSQPYQPLPATYATVTSPPADYAVSVVADVVPGGDGDIEKITVTVIRDGKELLTVDDYKVNR